MGKNNRIHNRIVYINISISFIIGIIQITQGRIFYPLLLNGLLQVFIVILISIMLFGSKKLQYDGNVNENSNELLNKLLVGLDQTNSIEDERIAEKRKQKNYININEYMYLIVIIVASVLFFAVSASILLRINAVLRDNIVEANYLIFPVIINLIQIFAYIFFSKWYLEQQDYDKKAKTWFVLIRVCQIISIVILTAQLFAIISVQKGILITAIIGIVLSLMFSVVILTSVIYKIFKKQVEDPIINIEYLNYILKAKNPLTQILDYLENQTSITFRSIWSIKYLKGKLPLFFLMIILVMWASTCFVQVNSQKQAIIFRLGEVQSDDILNPGLHLKLPWPIDKAGIYEVSRIKSFTVGYEAQESKDYLWTKKHDGEEYKLLLGDGKELVSVNIQVAYRISNLLDYALNYENPEDKLKGEAYQLIMEETVTTNLDNLLSEDRYMLSVKIQNSLNSISNSKLLGIEVTAISIQSIHPPVEVANSYQSVVSAKIQKEALKNIALAESKALIPKALVERDTLINDAVVEQLERKAKAISETILFEYQYQAFSDDEEFYKWRKWLESYEKAIGGKKIYIIEEDSKINDENLWFIGNGLYMEGY